MYLTLLCIFLKNLFESSKRACAWPKIRRDPLKIGILCGIFENSSGQNSPLALPSFSAIDYPLKAERPLTFSNSHQFLKIRRDRSVRRHTSTHVCFEECKLNFENELISIVQTFDYLLDTAPVDLVNPRNFFAIIEHYEHEKSEKPKQIYFTKLVILTLLD